ncbi:MAG: hypothetical protein AABW49_04705 [Nanoarchaeota archaeon]
MAKKVLITIIAISIVIILLYGILNIQILSLKTDKSTYTSSDTIKISWDIKTLSYCSCKAPYVIIHRFDESSGNWDKVTHKEDTGKYPICYNNKIVRPSKSLGCDLVSCKIGYYHNSNIYNWDPILAVPEETTCEGENGTYFISKPAPTGKYKASFGYLEREFDIT